MKNKQQGQALLVMVIFFTLASLVTISGLVGPVIRANRNARQLAVANHNYFVAEAAIEDVLYRLIKGAPVSTSETLNLDGATAVTTIADIGDSKVVSTVSTEANTVRKLETQLIVGAGASFNYGLQVGNGGLVMLNNSGVVGNVYSNGNIQGSNCSGQSCATITGSAFAANSAALTADQANDSPVVPQSAITFGNADATQDFAQSFQLSNDGPINQVKLFLKKIGSPANLTVSIVTNASGSPSSTVLTQGTLSAALVGDNYAWIDVPFSSNPDLTRNTTYWLVLNGSTFSNKYYIIGANSAYANHPAKLGQVGGAWTATNPLAGYFQLFLGGLTGVIDNVVVGEAGVGDIWAHTVNNSEVEGGLYCQVGSGNNKACDLSKPDPTPLALPISDANIAGWQLLAEAGGTCAEPVCDAGGNYALGIGQSGSLGPIKVPGNLTLDNNSQLTMTGTIWVGGNINLSNGCLIRLSAGYGQNSGMLITDNNVVISNNCSFVGSGDPDSYVLLLSAKNSPTEEVIIIDNNSLGVVYYAGKGRIKFSNNAKAKEATAYGLTLNNGAVITYESGLADLNFASGPSGGWNILSWKEVE